MFNVVNPATEQVFAQAPKADKPLLEVAIAAAEAAFPAWRMIDIADLYVVSPYGTISTTI
jgi:aldehyde dehydrogenase (NAD+)